MTYIATLLHNSRFVRIFEPDSTLTFSLCNGDINDAGDAKGRPGKADAILTKLGYERQQPWKNLSWGLKASVVMTSSNNKPK